MRRLLFPVLTLVWLCGSSPVSPAQDRFQARVSGLHPNKRLDATALVPAALTRTTAAEVTYYSNDITINSEVGGDAHIGYASASNLKDRTNFTSPAVRIVKGGRILKDLFVHNDSTLTVSSGSISGSLVVKDRGMVTLSEGSIAELEALNNSRVIVNSVSIKRGLLAYNGSTITMSGGSIKGDLLAYNRCTIFISGGNIGGVLKIGENSALNLFGVELKAILVDRHASDGADTGLYSRYTLYGELADGTRINGKSLFIENNSRARFTLHNVRSHPHLREHYPAQ